MSPAKYQAEVRLLHSILVLVASRTQCLPHSPQNLGEAVKVSHANSLSPFGKKHYVQAYASNCITRKMPLMLHKAKYFYASHVPWAARHNRMPRGLCRCQRDRGNFEIWNCIVFERMGLSTSRRKERPIKFVSSMIAVVVDFTISCYAAITSR